jgi:hypothetical protein
MVEYLSSSNYHQFQNDDGMRFGSFETFEGGDGFYWWPCFPGCLPDSEPVGPFDSEFECLVDALE